MKKRIPTARLVRQGRDERAFDRDFWKAMDPSKRLTAVWEMVGEADLIRGKNVGKSRLQRSVQNILRRTG